MHAVDGFFVPQPPPQRVKHVAIAPQRHDYVGVRLVNIAVNVHQLPECGLGFGPGAGGEGEFHVGSIYNQPAHSSKRCFS